ncbi:DUF3105 domain-containing protein [Flexivirga alba]|uniref:DUF3105 domain-containing protein n=1 Tax=Flexivirga alba TaxID=702742 RepID=A0ABW2AI52_9MICO
MPPENSASGRREKLQQLQRTQRASGRRRGLIIGGAAAAVVILAAGGITLAVTRSDHQSSDAQALDASQQIMPASISGAAVDQPAPATVANTTGISGVIAYNTNGYPAPGTASAGTLGHNHVTTPVHYAVTPPVGGDHNAIWMNAGVYTKPIPNERAVHNLEHGAVWVTYRPNLPQSQVNQLIALVGKQSLIPETGQGFPAGQSNRYIDLSPWTSQSLPASIVISSWGYQLRVDKPTDPRLQKFINTFRHSQKYTPEYGAPVDGIPTGTGGRAAAYGATKPNPSGTANG